jgi:hypothetical protein
VHQLPEDFLVDKNQLIQLAVAVLDNQLSHQATEQVSLEHQNRINQQAVVVLDKQPNHQAVGPVSLEHQNQLNHLVVSLVNLFPKMELNQLQQAQQTPNLS